LGIGDWGLGPIPNPQSPIPNPQSPIPISPNEKIRKENEELKKKLYKINGGNNTSQNASSKSIDKLKIDLQNKEATISLISKQKDFLISILTRITNLNSKNKINKGKILA